MSDRWDEQWKEVADDAALHLKNIMLFTPFHELFPKQIQRAYEDGLYTDLKITCGKDEFKVHKIIVCSQSKVFQAMLSGRFRESTKNTIDLTADGVSLVLRMIHCLYYGSYAGFDATVDAEDWKSAHQLHAAFYALADKYDIRILRDRAKANFNGLGTYNPQGLLKLIESIPIVYSSTPDSNRSLRDVTISRVRANASDLLHSDVEAAFQKVLIEVPDFNWDLHLSWIKAMPDTDSAKRPRNG